MRKVQNFGDDRLKGFCVHCGGANETVDHNPSKVFLDEPFPPDLPASPACAACNNGFSADEAYVACLVECAATGQLDTAEIERPKVARLLERNPRLLEAMRAARSKVKGGLIWRADIPRVKRVVTKLARGHAAFEVEPCLELPASLSILPIHLMPSAEREVFEQDPTTFGLWPEVGSRAMVRLCEGQEPFTWLVVQEGRYRYRVSWHEGIVVRIVIREYLAATVVWDGGDHS